MSQPLKIIRSIFLLLLTLFPLFKTFGQGDLLIYPKKLVFEGTQERVKILNFRNEGKDTATYKLSYLENRMTEDGELVLIQKPEEGQHFASPFLRFYPRSITLAPGEKQTVKIQLTRTSELETGEYRSHLYIRAEDKVKAREKKKLEEQQEDLRIELTAIYGISIPNLIRIGDTETTSEFTHVGFNKENFSLSLQVSRFGNQSLYGSLEVVHIDVQGVETPLGKRNIAIYSPGNTRNLNMKLPVLKDLDYTTGTLRITLFNQEDQQKVLTTADLDL